ncbi:MAG: nucleotide sugar dehydratase [Rhodospirillaceae bacterium TMED256]|nr:MAG: nucleotide sugar dehydratase [Rhodospirillaceae bacterium TMED256]
MKALMNILPKMNRARIALVHDTVVAATSFPLSLYLRVGDGFYIFWGDYIVETSLIFAAICAPVFLFSRLYKGIWGYASIEDLTAITKAVTIAILIFLPALFLFARLEQLPRSLPLIQWFVLMALLGGPRFLYRILKDRRLENILKRSAHRRVPVMLIGAGDSAELFIRQHNRDRNAPYLATVILDDKGGRIGREIHGVPIVASTDELDSILRDDAHGRPQKLILTNHNMDGAEVRRIFDLAEQHGCTLSRLPRTTQLQAGLEEKIETRPIAVEDLLGRPQTKLDRDAMRKLIEGLHIFVTGAGGSIGSELVRQISELAPASMTLFENSEYNLYQIDQELSRRHPHIKRFAVLGDVRDRKRVNQVMISQKPTLVFHAAALKHVPMVEQNPLEGVLTNVIGTRNVADACVSHGVKAMVLISTDKAVNPPNIMGATKRLAESYCQALDIDTAKTDRTRFVTVRFGNVLGSTGSVVPLFQKQLEAGGPLTITHPEVTRFFMTIREAVELVLQASALGTIGGRDAGRIHVLEMGAPVKILELAEQMIRLAGLQPNEDIEIKITGLRAGEKLHEELLHEGESLVSSSHPSLLLATPRTSDLKELCSAIHGLENAARGRRREDTLEALKKLVPEYAGHNTTDAAII